MPKIFSVDAKSNGLYGPVWAISAVVFDTDTGALAATFRERAEAM